DGVEGAGSTTTRRVNAHAGNHELPHLRARHYRYLMTRTSLAPAWALLAILLIVPAWAATPQQCGDADLSGARTVTDGVLVLRTAADLAGGCSVASRCDVDGNGSVTVTDGVAALRLAAGLPVEIQCPNTVVDRSRFTLFDFSHRFAFGNCPRIGAPSRFILAESDQGLVLNATLIVEGTAGDPDCLPDTTPVPFAACVKTMPLPSRVLTAEEEARVRAGFAAVALELERNPDCGRVTIEPCLIEDFNWDGFEVTDFACGEPRLAPDQAAALDALLASLL
ncbi:MAG: hypothetical protein ABI080_17815, partial [Candidatus Binatia bacterium]